MITWITAVPDPVTAGIDRVLASGAASWSGKKLGGIFQRPADVSPMQPAWMVYFSVASVDAAV